MRTSRDHNFAPNFLQFVVAHSTYRRPQLVMVTARLRDPATTNKLWQRHATSNKT